jgi:hypothetical protein
VCPQQSRQPPPPGSSRLLWCTLRLGESGPVLKAEMARRPSSSAPPLGAIHPEKNLSPLEPAKVRFMQRNDLIEDLSAATSDPAFRDSVLPRCPDTRPLGFQACRLQKRNHVSIEFRIAVQDHVSVRGSFGKRFAQLLHDPVPSRMAGHVEVQDLATSALDYEKAVEQLEGNSRHREKVESNDDLAVILEEGQPQLARVATALTPPKTASDGSFRDDEAELLKFTVDFGDFPTRILRRQAPDQRPDLLRDSWPAATGPGTPAPVQPKTGPVPADDGVGLDDDEDVGPAGPAAAEGRPEEPVQ